MAKENKKAGYQPDNAEQVESVGTLPKDTIIDGEIIAIDDGVVGDFVQGWKNPEQSAIAVEVECKEGNVKNLIFTYGRSPTGKMTYTEGSNLGKFAAKYGGLPRLAQKVKVVTDAKGFGKIKLD